MAVFNDRVNGVGVLLRFITPLMIGILLMMARMSLTKMEKCEIGISKVQESLTNHIVSDFGELRERLARIEERVGE